MTADIPAWATAVLARDTTEQWGEAPAATLHHDTRYEFKGTNNSLETTVHLAFRILNAAGVREFQQYTIHYHEGDDVAVRGWIVSNEARHEIDGGHIERTGRSRQFFTDDRQVVIQFSGAGIGDIILLEYQLRGNQFDTSVLWRPQKFRYPASAPSLTVQAPESWTAHFFPVHTTPAVLHQTRPGTWYVRYDNLAYMKKLPFEQLTPPWLGIRFLRDNDDAFTWLNFARWYTHKISGLERLTPTNAQDILEELTDSASREEVLACLAEFVQQQIRYVAIEIDEGGYLPSTPDDVLHKRYGDCKDKANLLRALLASRGIPAYLSIARAASSEEVRQEFPSAYQFNHAILAIPDITHDVWSDAIILVEGRPVLFFDPTDPFTPLGQLPSAIRGTRTLMTGDAIPGLVDLPASTPEHRGVVGEADIQLTDTGCSVQCTMTWYDNYAFEQRGRLRYSSEENRHAYVADLCNTLFGGNLLEWSVSGLESSADSLQLTCRVESRTLVRMLGNRRILDPVRPAIPFTEILDETEPRPLRVGLPFDARYTFRYHIPERWRIDTQLQTYAMENEFFNRSLHFTQDPTLLTVQTHMKLLTEVIPEALHAAFVQAVAQASKADKQAVILTLR